MDLTFLSSILTGVSTAVLSGAGTYMWTRKKYHTEVDQNTLNNLSNSVEIYKKIVDDLEVKIDHYIEQSGHYRLEMLRLKGIVYRMISKSCTDGTCIARHPYSEEEAKEILGILEYEDQNHEKSNKTKNN